MAFIQGKYQEALDIAKEAIKMDSNNADAYLCAGNANMSFENMMKQLSIMRGRLNVSLKMEIDIFI